MDFNKSLSGEDLKNLYTENKSNDHLQDPENLKKLLNYELDCMGDTFDPDFSFEVIDFCVDKLKELEPIDEQKMAFLGQKIMLEAKEYNRKMKFQRIRKFAAAAAVFGIIIGGVFWGSEEGYAGKFNFVHRLMSQDKGEQLSLKTPNVTLGKIEMKKGHLPNKLLDEFQFIESFQETSSIASVYNYLFQDTTGTELLILIKEYPDAKATLNNEIKINKHSIKQGTIDNHICYYSSNMDANAISWSQDNSIFKVTGDFDFEQLEEIISLYNTKEDDD